MPPASSSAATIEVVVVLPWVPATATFDFSRISSASISARRTTGRFLARAASSSGLPGLIAEEITTTCAPARFSAFWPMKTFAPLPFSRSVIGLALASEPCTVKPWFRSTSAIPDMPMPPMPTKWIAPMSCGSRVCPFIASTPFLSGEVLDQRRQMFRRRRGAPGPGSPGPWRSHLRDR